MILSAVHYFGVTFTPNDMAAEFPCQVPFRIYADARPSRRKTQSAVRFVNLTKLFFKTTMQGIVF
jgi:hypothetical protein